MAYGKIKADTLVYDNSGTDTDVTIASLGSKASLPASAGTVGASEVVQVDANKDITGFRNVTLSGDLTVNGTTTTIDSTTLTVEDKNIELGKVDTPTDTTADGGGITLKGASDKTFNWVDATDAWTSSEHIALGDNKKVILGTGSDFKVWHDGSDNFIDTSWNLTIRKDDGTENLAKFSNNGSCYLYYDNALKLQTSATGVDCQGKITDEKGDVRSIPKSAKSSAYVLVASDAGKAIFISTGGVTINNSVHSAGDAITIINDSGSDQTITQGAGITIYNSADAATGNRTLAGRGMCTVYFTSATEGFISGAGLS